MNINENFEAIEVKIQSLKQSPQFVEDAKEILHFIHNLDIFTAETKIFKLFIPQMYHKFNRILTENLALFETTEDDIIKLGIKTNLVTIFQITELFQEILCFIYEQSPVELSSLETILKCLPDLLNIFSSYLKDCPNCLKNEFKEQIEQIIEALKHLFRSYLHLLEFSVKISKNEEILHEILYKLCNTAQNLREIDATLLMSCWKTSNALINKFPTFLDNFNVSLVLNSLSERVGDIFKSLNEEISLKQIKIINFFTRIFVNIVKTTLEKFHKFFIEFFKFYVKIFEFDYEEGLYEVFHGLNGFLGQLIETKAMVFKENFGNILPNDSPIGFLKILNKILKLICDVSTYDWPIATLLKAVFNSLSYKALFSVSGFFQELTVNMSSAILICDVNFEATNILLRYLLSGGQYEAFLALEVYSLVATNIPADDVLMILIKLLYSCDEILSGFFTHRPEMVYFKCLLQRLFRILPDSLTEHVVKLFKPEEHIQVWRFLGFHYVYLDKKLIFEPIIGNTVKFLKLLEQGHCDEETPLNIAEGVELLSTIPNIDAVKNSKIPDIRVFLEKFWLSNFNEEIINNNFMAYFLMKISDFDRQTIILSKLQIFLNNPSYWTTIFKTVSNLLNSNPSEETLRQISALLPSVFARSNILFKEMYLETLKNLNENQNETLNILLDSLDAKLANQVFEYVNNNDKILSKFDRNVQNFEHKCLKWSEAQPIKNLKEEIKDKPPPLKRFRPSDKIPQKSNGIDDLVDEASDIITNLKSEVKCLLKVCKTDKLTAKNVSDLRIVMSQISSVMK